MRNQLTAFVLRHRAWLLVGMTLLLVLAVRVRLRDMPLERDEGEYAYAGQLILHGIPPYREAYNMKLPGTYAAYAVIMALFGQSPAAIHLGLAIVNLASIILMFLIGRELLDETAGIVTAVCFALLSLSPTILGLAGHATHFVLLPALAGIYLLLREENVGTLPRSPELGRRRREEAQIKTEEGELESRHLDSYTGHRNFLSSFVLRPSVFLMGLLFGLAFLMKQHGLFFGLFGGLYLLLSPAFEDQNQKSKSSPRTNQSKIKNQKSKTATRLSAFILGFLLPYAVTCLILWLAGVFPQFFFWTVSYAAKYAGARPIVYGPDFLRAALAVVVGPNLLLWLLPWTGALVMWWDKRLAVRHRFFIVALFFCSLASVSVGFYFRPHYFILLLPALALLSGVAVSRGLYLLRHDKTIELFLAIPILGLFAFGSLALLIGNGSMLFGDRPDEVVQELYLSTLNSEAVKAADFIKTHAAKDARIAVIGSEPEIYFYSNRRSATGYIYMYPLMEPQPYAAKMQDEMIAGIERARPEFAVFVNDDFSWQRLPDSLPRVDDWWKTYWPSNFEVAATFDIQQRQGESSDLVPAVNANGDGKYLLVLKRKK